MKLKNSLLYTIALLLCLSACNSNSEESCSKNTHIEIADVNPNGDSELALLMRSLFDKTKSIKQGLKNGSDINVSEYINDIERIHNAIPTDEDVKTPEFTAYTKSMISTAQQFELEENNKMEAFNDLVSSCINCHQSFCPGPISKIKKLKIKD